MIGLHIMAEELKNESLSNKHLTTKEIKEIVGLAKTPGLRYTVDLYLLDYIKHCFLEDNQLKSNIQKLQNVVGQLENADAKNGVEEVIKSLQCVQSEYNDYVEDMRVLANGGYPQARGAGQLVV